MTIMIDLFVLDQIVIVLASAGCYVTLWMLMKEENLVPASPNNPSAISPDSDPFWSELYGSILKHVLQKTIFYTLFIRYSYIFIK
jgi:hypothetical protein